MRISKMAIKLSGHYQPLNKVQKFSSKRIAIIALLSALAYVGRLICQPLPNVQPVTVIIVLITMNMGWIDGMCVAVLSIMLSNMLMGMGPWTLSQILTYIILVLLTRVFTQNVYLPYFSSIKGNIWIMVVFVWFLGIAYGFIISLFSYQMFGFQHFWPYYLQGLPFDMMHGFGNSVFYIILQPLLFPLMEKFLNQAYYDKQTDD